MKRIEKQLNVNELVDILKEKYGDRPVIKYIDIASIENQWTPEKKKVGVGGVLTLHLVYYEETKPKEGEK